MLGFNSDSIRGKIVHIISHKKSHTTPWSIVDGKEVSAISEVKPETIKAEIIYGKRGKNGVVVITAKK